MDAVMMTVNGWLERQAGILSVSLRNDIFCQFVPFKTYKPTNVNSTIGGKYDAV